MRIFTLLFILLSYRAIAQNYAPPLNIPLTLAGSFGELRPNHFHMGCDFKTGGVEGLPLFSVQNGYVARIQINPGSYGKVIYINHPNGVTSVYAHCQRFYGKIAQKLDEEQRKQKINEIELLFEPGDLPVNKGDTIAFSGNSGNSSGPHLHFELRTTATETALNPLTHGFSIVDNTAPTPYRIKAYAVTKEGYCIPGKSKVEGIKKVKDSYQITSKFFAIPANFCTIDGGIGFALETKDKIGTDNNCGTYEIGLSINKEAIFNQKLDSISFDHSRHINSHKDFAAYNGAKAHFHKSFGVDNNQLFVYPQRSYGIPAKPKDKFNLEYSLFDARRNKTTLFTKVVIDSGAILTVIPFEPHDAYLWPTMSYTFTGHDFTLTVPEGACYEPVLKNQGSMKICRIGDSKQPTAKDLEVRMTAKDKIHLGKQVITVTREGRAPVALATSYHNDTLIAASKYFGTFNVACDTLAPTIAWKSLPATDTLLRKRTFYASVNDKLSGIASYNFYVDGEWIPVYLDGKNNHIVIELSKNITEAKHTFQLDVIDACGNTASLTKQLEFTKKAALPVKKAVKKKPVKRK